MLPSGEIWGAASAIWILITYFPSLWTSRVPRDGALVGGGAESDSCRRTAQSWLLFYYSSTPCVIVPLPLVELPTPLWFVRWCFKKKKNRYIVFIHLDICLVKSLSSLELVREGCLLNDLRVLRGLDLNLFGHGLRACKLIIAIWFKNTTCVCNG